MQRKSFRGLSAAGARTLAACGGEEPVTPPAASTTLKRGGTMKIGSAVQRLDHPARLSWVEGANQLRQVAEYLTETDPDNITRPWLLERWEADAEVKTWTLYLHRGIRFNNGAELQADDDQQREEQHLKAADDAPVVATPEDRGGLHADLQIVVAVDHGIEGVVDQRPHQRGREQQPGAAGHRCRLRSECHGHGPAKSGPEKHLWPVRCTLCERIKHGQPYSNGRQRDRQPVETQHQRKSQQAEHCKQQERFAR